MSRFSPCFSAAKGGPLASKALERSRSHSAFPSLSKLWQETPGQCNAAKAARTIIFERLTCPPRCSRYLGWAKPFTSLVAAGWFLELTPDEIERLLSIALIRGVGYGQHHTL